MQMPFMVPHKEQFYVTESSVSVPPALIITDEGNNVWTLGFQAGHRGVCPRGEFAYNVLRNGSETGEIASRIEKRKGRILIFTKDGWKRWTSQSFI
jgi:hypothetical protein